MGNKTVATNAEKYIKFIVYLAIIVLLNIVIGLTPPGKIDLTQNRLFSISRASREAVKTLKEPLTIKVFFSDNLPAPYNGIKSYLRDILKEYSDHANKKYFNYEFIDVGGSDDSDSDEIQANRDLARDYKIEAENIQVVEKDEVSFKRAYMGMAFIHGDLIETTPPIKSTNGVEFRITSMIQKMNNKISALLALEEDIQVKLFLTTAMSDLFPKAAELPGMVKGVVDKLNKANYNRLDLIHIDTTKDPGKTAEAEALGAYGFSTQDTRYFGDLFLVYGEKIERIPLIELVRDFFTGQYDINVAAEADMETIINDAITTLIDTNEKIGYLTSNSTLPLNEEQQDPNSQGPAAQGATNFRDILQNEYSIVEVDLAEGKPIPEGIKCLILAGPDEKFTDYQLFQIDQFLMQGKSLAVFLDGQKIVFPEQMYGYPPEYLPSETGLETLLEHYGVTVEPSYVFDENGVKQGDATRGSFMLYQAPMIQNAMMNTDLDFIQNVRGVIVYNIAPLTVDEEKLKSNNITPLNLFSSSRKSWIEKELPNQQTIFTVSPPFKDDDKSSYPLAYILEGKFTSYYADKPVPAKPEKEEPEEETAETTDLDAGPSASLTLDAENVTIEDRAITTGEPGKIFVIGSSFVLDNQLFSSDVGMNMMFYMNILDYLNGKRDYAIMRTKLQQYNPLNETTLGFRNFTKIFNIGILPVLFILIGVFVFLNRNARKSNIQQQFTNQNTNQKEVKK